MMGKKPTNKIVPGPGRKPNPKPAANNIKNMNTAAANKWFDDNLKRIESNLKQQTTRARAVKPVGAKASNAIYSRKNLGGPLTSAIGLAAEYTLKPLAYKAGEALGRQLRPVARKLDEAMGLNRKNKASSKTSKPTTKAKKPSTKNKPKR